jgi:hypothetical protein
MISTIIIVVLCSPLSYGQSQRAVQGAATKRVPVQKKEVPVDRQMAKDMLYLSVRVEAVQTWPINICEGTWQARISNPQGAPIGEALAIPYQYSSSQNKWLEGPAVQFELGAGQKVTVQGQWKQQPWCKEFKVAFKPAAASKTYAEKSVRFPAGGNPSLAIERFEIASEYVAAHIRNGGQAAACNVSVQRLWASKEDPNQFTPDGGAFYSLPGNRTTPCKSFRDMSTWREGKDLIKIKIYGENSRVIAEKVFPIQQ